MLFVLLPVCQVMPVQFPCFTQAWPSSIGWQSIAREKSQTCSSVAKLPLMERSVLWLQLSPAPNRKVGQPNGELSEVDGLRFA